MSTALAWAPDARVVTHVMAAFWDEIHGHRRAKWLARRSKLIRHRGNLARLPKPIAAYRLRACLQGVAVEIVGCGGFVDVLGHQPDFASAREALKTVLAVAARPILPEVW